MLPTILLYTASGLTLIWGIAHIAAMGPVVRGFAPLAEDNRRILIMEWIAEGLTLCFIGLIILLLTLTSGPDNPAAVLVYGLCAGMLVLMAFLTQLTGARSSIKPIKICPYVKAAAAILLLLGIFL